MDTHLRDRQDRQRNRNAGFPHPRCPGDDERDDGQQGRQSKPDDVAAYAFVFLFARSGVLQMRLVLGMAHYPAPIRYTTENSPTQMMSSACQNRLKQRRRLMMSARKPFAKTCAIMVSSQSRPAETCSPWQPTSVKNADRNALRDGPAPSETRPANSVTSSAMNMAPKMNVTAIAP